MISGFTGKYAVLSNFAPAPIMLDGVQYPNVETAYQAAKTLNPVERDLVKHTYRCVPCGLQFRKSESLCTQCHGPVVRFTKTPAEAKKAGKRVTLRPGWEEMKLKVLYQLVYQKFTNNTGRKMLLLSTGVEDLVETNFWGDTFYGVCDGVGDNWLGHILMVIRAELRNRSKAEAA